MVKSSGSVEINGFYGQEDVIAAGGREFYVSCWVVWVQVVAMGCSAKSWSTKYKQKWFLGQTKTYDENVTYHIRDIFIGNAKTESKNTSWHFLESVRWLCNDVTSSTLLTWVNVVPCVHVSCAFLPHVFHYSICPAFITIPVSVAERKRVSKFRQHNCVSWSRLLRFAIRFCCYIYEFFPTIHHPLHFPGSFLTAPIKTIYNLASLYQLFTTL